MPEIEYTPTTLMVPLPSNGKCYPASSPLHKKETIAVREMSAAEEDILTSMALIRTNKALETVINNCIVDKSIDSNKLIVGDRNSITIGLVLASYGSIYRASVNCPQCGKANKDYEFDINSLPVKYLKIEPINEGVNEFEWELPKTKNKITFKLLTAEDDKEIREFVEKRKSAVGDTKEYNVTTKLKKQILSINGVTDRSKIAEFVDRKMPIQDSVDFRKYLDENSPTIDTSQHFSCKECGASDRIEMPISFDFFWR